MKQRLLVAAVGVPLLLAIFLVLPPAATTVLTAAIAVIACYELLHTAAKDCPPAVYAVCMLCAAFQAAAVHMGGNWWLHATWLLLMMLCAFCVARYGTEGAMSFRSAAVAILGGSVFPMMYACIARVRLDPDAGRAYVLMPFVIAFLGDTFSMLGGMLLGKKKFAPRVSPNKTWAGFFAGPVGSALGMLALALIASAYGASMPVLPACLLGAAANLFGQLGDLTMSLVKREAGVKDYSRLFLTHGGMLDRFDSTLFIAPVVYFAVHFGIFGGLS